MVEPRAASAEHGPEAGTRAVSPKASVRAESRAAIVDLLWLVARHPVRLAATQRRLLVRLAGIALGWSGAPAEGAGRLQWRLSWTRDALALSLHELIAQSCLPAARRRRLQWALDQLLCLPVPDRAAAETGRRPAAGRASILGAPLRRIRKSRAGHRRPEAAAGAPVLVPGRDVAATAGAVIHRDALCELIQYAPRTVRTDPCPLLLVPPPEHRHYLFDLTPRTSLVRYALDRGESVYALSWRNPTAAQDHWGVDEYAAAIDRAIECVHRVAAGHPVKLAGALTGASLAVATVARRAAAGREEAVACLSLLLPCRPSCAGAPEHSSSARADERNGAPASPVSAAFRQWLSHGNRVTERLYGDLHGTGDGTTVGAAAPDRADGFPQPVFVLVGDEDRDMPRDDRSRTPGPAAGPRRFVRVSGALADVFCAAPDAMPSGRAGRLAVAEDPGPDTRDGRDAASDVPGSWWPEWLDWCARCGDAAQPAPQAYGSDEIEPLGPAPGRYVRQR